MHSSIALQELVVVIAATNHSPAVINLEFLKYSGIIPMEWELARAPIYTPQVVQLTFQNGVTITAQPNRVFFAEVIENKAVAEIEVAKLARKYAQSLPNMEFEAVGFNPTGHTSLGDQPEAIRQYFGETLLAAGPWMQVGQAPVRARINFTYTLERGQLNLTVSEAGLRQEDETVKPVIVFNGNFSYPVQGTNHSERLESLTQSLEYWQNDLEAFEAIINQNFLASHNSKPSLLSAFAA